MPKSIFISLPVTDVARSTAFYEAIGFEKDPRLSNDQASAMRWSDAVSVMLASHAVFGSLTPKRIIDPRTSSGALFALAFDSRDEVDRVTEAAIAAGGREAHGPEDEGFMYSRAFEDPDGHGWGPFWMNPDTGGGDTSEAHPS